jgi:hypothetical protein
VPESEGMASAALNAEIRDYDARVFQRLNEFHLARDYLEDKRESLAELGDVICRHGLHQRVGVSLLHKHFEISDNELVVREFVRNLSYIKPWNIDQLSSPVPSCGRPRSVMAAPYTIRLNSATIPSICRPTRGTIWKFSMDRATS